MEFGQRDQQCFLEIRHKIIQTFQVFKRVAILLGNLPQPSTPGMGKGKHRGDEGAVPHFYPSVIGRAVFLEKGSQKRTHARIGSQAGFEQLGLDGNGG